MLRCAEATKGASIQRRIAQLATCNNQGKSGMRPAAAEPQNTATVVLTTALANCQCHKADNIRNADALRKRSKTPVTQEPHVRKGNCTSLANQIKAGRLRFGGDHG